MNRSQTPIARACSFMIASVHGVTRPSARRLGLMALLALQAQGALAGSGTCAGTGTITVTDVRVGQCILEDGDSVTITGSGSITGSLNGVLVDLGQSAQIIENAGTIVGNPFDGIHVEGNLVRIDNDGVITGPGQASTTRERLVPSTTERAVRLEVLEGML